MAWTRSWEGPRGQLRRDNRVFRKPGGGGRSAEMLTAALGQSYYSDAHAALYDKDYQTANGTAPSKFSPCRCRSARRRRSSINAQFRAEYDTKFEAIRTMSADGTVHLGLVSHDGRMEPAAIHRGSAGLQRPHAAGPLSEQRNHLAGAEQPDRRVYTFNYDILHRRYLQQRMMNYYNSQCCGFAVEYQSFNLQGLNTAPVTKDQRFNFTVTLAGIGSFSNFFGAFGGRAAPRPAHGA